MKFIAFYFGKKEEDGKKEENLEDKILAFNPVLEALGNAKTVLIKIISYILNSIYILIFNSYILNY